MEGHVTCDGGIGLGGTYTAGAAVASARRNVCNTPPSFSRLLHARLAQRCLPEQQLCFGFCLSSQLKTPLSTLIPMVVRLQQMTEYSLV